MNTDLGKREWRCMGCDKLLGILEGFRLSIRFARGHQYQAGLPVSCVCRSCRTLNEMVVPGADGPGTLSDIEVSI